MMPIVIPAFWKTLKAKKVKNPAQRRRPKESLANCAQRRIRQATRPRRQSTPVAPTKPAARRRR